MQHLAPTPMHAIATDAVKKSGEYERVRAPTALWTAYISAVCGCIFAVVLKGLFGISIAAGSSVISDTAILIATPAKDQIRGFNEGALFAVCICAGLGSFFSCALLTARSGGRVAVIKMLFPTVDSWTLRHQLHVTVCICCLFASHAIADHELDRLKFASDVPVRVRSAYLRTLVGDSPSYATRFHPCVFVTFGSGTSWPFSCFPSPCQPYPPSSPSTSRSCSAAAISPRKCSISSLASVLPQGPKTPVTCGAALIILC